MDVLYYLSYIGVNKLSTYYNTCLPAGRATSAYKNDDSNIIAFS